VTAAKAEWADDVLPGYQQSTFALGADPDGEGDLWATLMRRSGATSSPHVVLAVHGYTDYFFNTDLADHFTRHGFRFYALDLPKCGRSWRQGQTPHFTTDLARYDKVLERALVAIAAENPKANVLMYGHSAGGLIVSLWLDRVRQRDATRVLGLTGLILNSPFLDLHGPRILRTWVTSGAINTVSRIRKGYVVRRSGRGGYGLTLHRDHHGEFDYNLTWKPLGGFPITAGWIHAIRQGQAQLHRGLDVNVPNLILRSDHSVPETTKPDKMQRGDAVLDVTQIARWAGCIGNRTSIIPVIDAKHDVFLSLAEPRNAAYRELGRWLDDYLDRF
jgi:alpha-beta hydrolase superfamily lysophospholipase